MSIQEIKGQEGMPEYSGRKQVAQAEGFQESLIQNLESRKNQKENVEKENKNIRINDRKTNAGILGTLSGVRVNAVTHREAVQAAEVRHMSYEESDNIEIAVTEGYTLKGKLEGQQVYVEAKYEDGRTEAYQVDTAKVQEQTQHRIEKFALETVDSTAQKKTVPEGATDSIGIILRQMGEPQAGEPITKTVIHNGVAVSVTKDALYGNSITIGGSASPDWIQVHTSVGTVNIDLNDMESLMKCLDMFSPEDLNAILRKITEVKQARDALQEIDNMRNTPVERGEDSDREDEES